MDEPQRNAHRAAMTADHPEIPYGRADFKGIRLDRALYVDKTGFLAPLERWRYVVFIRPRRFGKTCWLSTLQSYYDRTERASFATVFGDTEVAAAPTPNRNRYMMLRFDFSGLDAPVDALPALFEECCDIELRRALRTNAELFAGAAARAILSHSSVNAKLRELFAVVGEKGIPLYVLVDEYDNVANAVLARHGEVLLLVDAQRRLLPRLLCELEGGHEHRRGGADVRHRSLAGGAGRPHQRLQHRLEPEPAQ